MALSGWAWKRCAPARNANMLGCAQAVLPESDGVVLDAARFEIAKL